MNDLERLRKHMNEYRETSRTLCDMLDKYLTNAYKPRTEHLKKQEQGNALDNSSALRNGLARPR